MAARCAAVFASSFAGSKASSRNLGGVRVAKNAHPSPLAEGLQIKGFVKTCYGTADGAP